MGTASSVLETPHGSGPALAVRINRGRVEALYQRSTIALATVAINAILLGAVVWTRAPATYVVSWVGILWAVSAGRLWLARAYQRRGKTDDPIRWERRYALGAAANGLVWGVGGYTYVGADLAAAVGTVFVVGGMVAGASSSNATSPLSFVGYAGPALLPVVVGLLLENDVLHSVMGATLVLFGLAMAMLAKQGCTALVTAMELRFRNGDLVDELERRSRERSGRLRILLDQAGVVVIVADPETLRIVDVGENASGMFGARTEALLTKTLPELGPIVSIRSAAEWKAVFMRAESEGEQTLSDMTTTDADASDRELSVTVRRVAEQPYALLVLKDVRQRRELERHLAQTSLLASLGSLATGIAHEVNNPLAFMLVNLHHLREHLVYDEAEFDSRLSNAVNDTIEGAERIQGIVRDLIANSQPRSGGGDCADLHEVVATCLQVANSEIVPRAQVTLELDGVPKIKADPLRLTQAVLNLVLNAAQSVAAGGRADSEIILRAQHRPDNETVELLVQDTGCGFALDPDKRFDPFAEANATEGNVGVGLSACHAIVSSLHGTLSFESDSEGTNTVTICVPACPP